MGLTNRGTLEHTRSLNAAAENAQRNIRRDYKAKEKELREQQQRHAKIRVFYRNDNIMLDNQLKFGARK